MCGVMVSCLFYQRARIVSLVILLSSSFLGRGCMVGPPPLRCWPHLFFFNLLVLFEFFRVCHLCPSCCQLTNNVVVRLYHGWLYIVYALLLSSWPMCSVCCPPVAVCRLLSVVCASAVSSIDRSWCARLVVCPPTVFNLFRVVCRVCCGRAVRVTHAAGGVRCPVCPSLAPCGRRSRPARAASVHTTIFSLLNKTKSRTCTRSARAQRCSSS